MYLKSEYTAKLLANPELRRQLAVETGTHPETIKRCAVKNDLKKGTRLTTKPFLKFMSKHFNVKEAELICPEFKEVIISDGGDEQESIKNQLGSNG